MGEVYEVLHTLLGKRFALKLISRELSQDEKARNLFRREGREAGNLDHPNIVRVDDCGEVDGRMYLRMELIEGRPCNGDTCVTLTDYIIACSLRVSPTEAIPILRDILRGLNYAHSRRRVHRDIKPSNILMTSEAAKIGDFGLVMSGARPGGDMSQMSEVVVMGLGAQSMMNATQTTGASAAAGTPDYMAPELLSGSVEANYSTDVYSVGILLLEMLTGSRRVGAAKPSQLLRSHYKLDPWWDQLYERSTAYHEDRFANAGEMLRFFTEVAGLAETEPSKEEGVQKTTSRPATTRVLANWGNAPAAEPSAPPEPLSPPAAKRILDPPRVATKPATAPAPTPDRAPSPMLSGEAMRSPTSPQPTRVGRTMPWMPIGVGGVLVVLGAFLYLATRTTDNPEKTLKAPDVEPPIPTRPRSDATVSPSKPASSAEPPASKLRPAPLAVGSGAVPTAPGVKAPTEAQTPRLIQTDQQNEVRRKQEESMVSEALKRGALGEAWRVVNKADSLVNRDLRDSVLGAYQALKKVEEAFASQNVERLRESLATWQKAKPDQLADPEVIPKARDLVKRSNLEGEQQLAWRERIKTAIANEDVPGIRNLLADKRYETDASRVIGERTIKSLEDISERLRAQVREAIKKEDLAAARLTRESLNQHLKRTKQETDSQLDGEIGAAQRGILERKVEKAVAELDRYKPNENPPPNSSDPELIGNQRYQDARRRALKRQEDWKIENAPKPIQEPPLTPPPSLEPPLTPSTPPTVLSNPKPEIEGSVEKKSFEAFKNRISGLGNRRFTQQAKQEMINFLQLYQKNHPEDAREASRLIENLRNR